MKSGRKFEGRSPPAMARALYTEYDPPWAPMAFLVLTPLLMREAVRGPRSWGLLAPHLNGVGLTPLEFG